jgi:LuxR family maltose regulon positive regulatory protein
MHSLVRTKLYFPQARRDFVARPRLIERLQTGLQGPLTLIAAPAGSGKTTLMTEWRAGIGAQVPAAWLGLDANDNNLYTFLSYLSAALEMIHQGMTANTQPLIQSEQPLPAEAILTVLVNEIDQFHTDFVLALDDYHQIAEPAIHAALDFILRNQPPKMHLVILSRSDPNLPLARLRARGQMMEIRSEHLRFTVEETAQFLNQAMGLNLTQAQVAMLADRAEGWIVGLHMAALSLRGRSQEALDEFIVNFTGSHRYIMDYLVGEVLANQPSEQREFLLKTSILERLNAGLCDAVTERKDSQEILQALEAANLFLIPLDDDRGWFRYHHLFADVLHNRLMLEMPNQVTNLHRRAADHLCQNGLYFAAIEHALIIADYVFVRDLFRRYHSFLNRTENRAAVSRLFARLPQEYLQTEPWMCLGYAWIVWGEGKMQAALDLLDCAQNAYSNLKGQDRLPFGDLEYDGLPAEFLAFRALITTQKGEPDEVIALAEQALSIVPASAPVISAVALLAQQVAYRQKGQMEEAINACQKAFPLSRMAEDIGTRVSVLHSLGVGLMIKGKLSQLVKTYEAGLQHAASRGEIDNPRYDLIYFKLADVAYVRNELDQVEELLQEGFRRSEKSTYLWPRFYGKIIQVQWFLAKGNRADALRLVAEIEGLLERVRGAYFEVELADYLMRVKIILGKLEGARAWTQTCQKRLRRPLDYTQIENAIQLAFTWEVLDELDWAIELAQEIEAAMAAVELKHLQLYALIPQILAWVKKKNLSQAQKSLHRALTLGEPEGYVRVFLDAGSTIKDLLVEMDSDKQAQPLTRYIRLLLDAFANEAVSNPSRLDREPHRSLISPRELELLRLIAAGYTNKEIASELFISLGTVKRHTVNIFTKLEVKNRTEAVARARQSGLL